MKETTKKIIKNVKKTIKIGVYSIIALFIFYGFPRKTTVKLNGIDTRKGIMYIYTDEGQLRNEDNLYYFKTNSGTIQNDAVKYKGSIRTLYYYGVRITLLSIYPNIISISERSNGK